MKSTCCNAVAIPYSTQSGDVDFICNKCNSSCDVSDGLKDLIEAYKLGYADRNAKMPPFGDSDPKEYILSCLKNM